MPCGRISMPNNWVQLVLYTVLFVYVGCMLVAATAALRSHLGLLKWDAAGSRLYMPLVFVSVVLIAILAGWLVFPVMWWSSWRRRHGR